MFFKGILGDKAWRGRVKKEIFEEGKIDSVDFGPFLPYMFIPFLEHFSFLLPLSYLFPQYLGIP